MRSLYAPRRLWARLSLSAQFMVASVALMIAILSLAGVTQSWWVTKTLFEANAEMASLYMEAVIQPHVRASSDAGLTEVEEEALKLDVTALMSKSGIRAVTLWRPDGTVVFSTYQGLIGRRFASEEVTKAASGMLAQDFIKPDTHNRSLGIDNEEIVEIYIPLRNLDGRVVMVGEFYQSLSVFRDRLAKTLVGSWTIGILFSLLAILVLFGLVNQASQTIKRQRLAIRQHARTTLRYRHEVRMLQSLADQSRRHAAQATELLLSRIGGDIHDGPMQVLALAMLQVGASGQQSDMTSGASMPANLIAEAITELRSMSAGLILPELAELNLEETIYLVVSRHERRTGTAVQLELDPMPETSLELRACIYRILQEALNNSATHAKGREQAVTARMTDQRLRFIVENAAPDDTGPPTDLNRPRLGLLSARQRAQTFGGTVEFDSRKGGKSSLIVAFPTSSLA